MATTTCEAVGENLPVGAFVSIDVPANVLAALTIQATSVTVTYGAAVPGSFTPTYVGLVNGDTAPATPPICTTPAHTGSNAGTYPIACSGAADPNYAISYTAGTLTIIKAATSTLLTASPGTPLFGHPVTFTATVTPTPPSSGTPNGTVTFSDGATVLATVALNNGQASFTTAMLQPGAHSLTASYAGDSNFLPSASTGPTTVTVGFSQPCITTTHSGPLTVTGGQSLCVGQGGKVVGAVTVQGGAAFAITGGSVTGPVVVNGAAAVTLCQSTFTGSVTVQGTTGYVLMGSDSDDAPGCPGNSITGPVTLSSNTGGLEVSANSVTGSVSITNNSGAGLLPEDAVPEVEANRVTGSLSCSGNTPTLGNQNNSVLGPRSGQCA